MGKGRVGEVSEWKTLREGGEFQPLKLNENKVNHHLIPLGRHLRDRYRLLKHPEDRRCPLGVVSVPIGGSVVFRLPVGLPLVVVEFV